MSHKTFLAAELTVYKAALATKLRELMISRNMTAKDIERLSVAALMRGKASTTVTAVNVHQYLGQRALPSMAKLYALADVLKVRPDVLLAKEAQCRRVVLGKRGGRKSERPWTVQIVNGPGLERARLVVSAAMPTREAHTLAREIAARLTKIADKDPEVIRWKLANPDAVMGVTTL